jgi:CBS domain-containing protein
MKTAVKIAVRDVMTTHVVWVRKGASFKEMAAALRENRVSAFPVIDDQDKVIGVVSEADMLAKEALIGEPEGLPARITGILRRKDQEKARGVTAGDLMTRGPVTVRPGDTIEHAARLMYDRGVKRLPVTDAGGHLVGIISRADVLAVFDRPDQDICREIKDRVIPGEFSADPGAFTVAVKDGIVTLGGKPGTSELGHDIVRRIRHVPGVVAVRDRLSYPPSARPADRFDVLASFPID